MARTPPVRTAGQRPLIAVVAGAVLLGSITLALDSDRRPQPISAEPEVVIQSGDGDGSPVAIRVGPPTGSSVDRYIADRGEAMRDATDVELAVVSFAELQSPATAVAAIGEGLQVQYVLLRMPLESAAPIAVRAEGDAVAAATTAINDAVERLQQDEQSFLELLASDSLDDPEFEADAEQQASMLKAARTAVADGAPLVHAVVVAGPLAALQALQQDPAVRLVDPAPIGTDVATSTFYGLVPSDEVTVRYGRSVVG